MIISDILRKPLFYFFYLVIAVFIIFSLMKLGEIKYLNCTKICDDVEDINLKCSLIGTSQETFDKNCYYLLENYSKTIRFGYTSLIFLSPILSFFIVYFIFKKIK